MSSSESDNKFEGSSTGLSTSVKDSSSDSNELSAPRPSSVPTERHRQKDIADSSNSSGNTVPKEKQRKFRKSKSLEHPRRRRESCGLPPTIKPTPSLAGNEIDQPQSGCENGQHQRSFSDTFPVQQIRPDTLEIIRLHVERKIMELKTKQEMKEENEKLTRELEQVRLKYEEDKESLKRELESSKLEHEAERAKYMEKSKLDEKEIHRLKEKNSRLLQSRQRRRSSSTSSPTHPVRPVAQPTQREGQFSSNRRIGTRRRTMSEGYNNE